MTYAAPLADQRFALDVTAGLADLAARPRFAAATPDVVEAVLGESARLAETVFAPLNRIGDTEGARWRDGAVTLPAGFAEAYQLYADGGWAGLAADPAYGGQGLPFVLSLAVQEQFTAANMAFSLNMLLTQGAIAALSAHGSAEQQRLYLEPLVSGAWTGTMNLTEPQAGSDVGALAARAVPAGDGSYRITGTKIFITWGEHDLAANIIHLVLARLPGAPPGTKGISLFVVPKFLPNADGRPGARNDLRCVSLEHKLGIHASPTCTMRFGDEDRCIGWLVGPEHGGMRAMFTMMNHARIGVGLQGVAIADRAYQAASAYARDRIQGRPIVDFPDVRRMLMTMRATVEAARALVYYTAAAVDRGHDGDADAQRLADLLTPVSKAYATDIGVEIASLAIQVFGGTGYVEATGVAQHLRDARIAPIYEGTNGIQAMDLVGRKLAQGHWRSLFKEMRAASHADEPALAALEDITHWLATEADEAARAAAATPYLRLFAVTLCGHLLAAQAAAAARRLNEEDADKDFLAAKIATARFYIDQLVPQATALAGPIRSAGVLFRELPEGVFRA